MKKVNPRIRDRHGLDRLGFSQNAVPQVMQAVRRHDIHFDSQQVPQVQAEIDQIEQSPASFEFHQQIDIARFPVVAASYRAEHTDARGPVFPPQFDDRRSFFLLKGPQRDHASIVLHDAPRCLPRQNRLQRGRHCPVIGLLFTGLPAPARHRTFSADPSRGGPATCEAMPEQCPWPGEVHAKKGLSLACGLGAGIESMLTKVSNVLPCPLLHWEFWAFFPDRIPGILESTGKDTRKEN